MVNGSTGSLVILMPVFNDSEPCRRVLDDLDQVLAARGEAASVLLLDDGSAPPLKEALAGRNFRTFDRVQVVRLKRNLGHQRAIAIGIAYIAANLSCQAVVLMDSDGQDDPRDVPRLLERYLEESRQKIVFAERTQRSEHWGLRSFHRLYKLLYRLLTGQTIRMGNFSVIPYSRICSLIAVPELWCHYAAAVFISRQPFCAVPTRRRVRAEGPSKMNFVALVIHGLSSISVFSEVVGVRLLLATTILIVLTLCGITTVSAVRLFTDLAIPGWATFASGILLVVLLQAILFGICFSMIVLNGRRQVGFLAARDYDYFVDEIVTLFEKE